jgi:tetratricopeptide (TPR) repeat protein
MDWGAFEGSKSLRENTLRQLGWIRLAADDCLGARGAFEESLEVAQQSGSLVGLIGLHLGRGYCDLIEGVADTAQSHFEAALALSEERTDKRLCVESLLALGETSLFHNQIEKARDSSLRALRLARELGLRKGLSRALCRIGTVVSRQGQHELAIRCFAASSALLYHMNGAVPSFQLGGYDQALARVRSEIAPDRFQRLWSEGMTTIDYADQVLQRYAES